MQTTYTARAPEGTYTAAAYAAMDDDGRAIMLEAFTALDMRAEAAAILSRGEDFEIHTLWVSPEATEEWEPSEDVLVTVLWIPGANRAGCCTNGDTQWTDATGPEDAARRYVNDDMVI